MWRHNKEMNTIPPATIGHNQFSDALIEALPGLFFVVDQDGKLVRWNENHRILLGYSDEDLSNLETGYDLFVDPNPVRALAARERGIARRGRYVASLKTKDGREVPCEFHVVRQQINDVWFTIGTAFDLTEKRDAEQRLSEQRNQLARLQRVAMISETATVLGHELTQPVSAISNNANAALTLLESASSSTNPEVMEYLRDVVDLAEQSSAIVGRIRGFLGAGESRRTDVSMNELVRNALHLVRADMAARGIATKLLPLARDAVLRTDAVQVMQVLFNLIGNAAEAIDRKRPGRPTIRIVLSRRSNHVTVKVADNGPGIEAHLMDKLFQPFVSSKSEGLGLGLMISRNLVEALGGQLTARNSQGGAVFSFSLPLNDTRLAHGE